MERSTDQVRKSRNRLNTYRNLEQDKIHAVGTDYTNDGTTK